MFVFKCWLRNLVFLEYHCECYIMFNSYQRTWHVRQHDKPAYIENILNTMFRPNHSFSPYIHRLSCTTFNLTISTLNHMFLFQISCIASFIDTKRTTISITLPPLWHSEVNFVILVGVLCKWRSYNIRGRNWTSALPLQLLGLTYQWMHI